MHVHAGDTDEALLPRTMKAFLRRRLREFMGLVLLGAALLLTVALATWSVSDPSLDRAVDGDIRNMLGWPGAVVADLLIVQLGLAALLPVAVLTAWASRLFALRPLNRPHARLLWLLPAIIAAAGFLAAWPTPARWPLGTGLGGNLGDALFGAMREVLAFAMRPLAATVLATITLALASLFTLLRALDISGDALVRAAGVLGEKRQQKVAEGIGLFGHLRLWLTALPGRMRRRSTTRQAAAPETAEEVPREAPPMPAIHRPQPPMMEHAAPSADDAGADDAPPVAAFAPRMRQAGRGLLGGMGNALRRFGQLFDRPAPPPAPMPSEEADALPLNRQEPRLAPVASGPAQPVAAPRQTQEQMPQEQMPQQAAEVAASIPPAAQPATEAAMMEAPAEELPAASAGAEAVRVGAPMDSAFLPQELDEAGQPVEDAPAMPGAPGATAGAAPTPQPAAQPAAAQPAAAPRPAAPAKPKRPRKIKLPSLDILARPDPNQSHRLSDEQLQENALQLAQVLEDFGVKGQIVNVCPGPVVTLYEFQPAPGIKSSRVIGLADDIARSMCAISARIAVVPGRNVIGIELPNDKRETVFLREMLESKGYRQSKFNLPLALGKNIAGEPVFADLARMPHLLIAGTTGSGKSVGINTFIMSLLYKYTPEHCRLIMIDPKMLELSIYDGIPHLLTPVVTDPRKAVVALKWAVREMEDRYQKMAMLGVRNIDGYNAKVGEAVKKGETITRTVQTGFDPNTGEPMFEEEELDLKPLPFIVVIIDEMADLMMVAGKDIEGAVQRLAQMARAAGIHVIMATQRPSVDVITGTIKANFPTRISFQVTSKIDSRTILGEQGAEQLLGQGDMLYMAGGGRIVRLHGPFVSDEEVEHVVSFLKKQAPPEYVEAVTSEEEEAPAATLGENGAVGATGDDLYDRAVQVVLRDRKVSTSYIQRRLQIGYNKAATLIERMEAEGLISAPNSKGRREVLVGGDSAHD